MVDLRLDIRNLFPQPVIKVTSDLVPQPFHGNRYQVTDARYKTSQIIDTLGQLSASAQRLSKPITTTQKLRNIEDQTIYLMADTEVQPRGVAIGLLKIGKRDLYVYNAAGKRHHVRSPCILDFYIHDTHQRAGHGKVLFDTMLAEEKLLPHQYSIDRPSDKMISFLKKHYGLHKTIPQPNHYLLFEGYFDDKNMQEANQQHTSQNPLRIEYLAMPPPSNFEFNDYKKMAVRRFEIQPDQCMADIIRKQCEAGNR